MIQGIRSCQTKSRNYSKAFSASFYQKSFGRHQSAAALIRDVGHVSYHPRGVLAEPHGVLGALHLHLKVKSFS